MPRTKRLDPAILEAALASLEAQGQRIAEQISQVRAVLGGARLTAADERPVRPRRRVSAAGRRRIAQAQKKRWAKVRQAKAAETKPKRRLSAAGRKRVAAAARKRWAEVRAMKAAQDAAKPASKAAKRVRRAAARRGTATKPTPTGSPAFQLP